MASSRSNSRCVLGSLKLKKNLAASIGTSSRSVESVIALPERFDSFTVSPFLTNITICIITISSLLASTPSAVRAAFILAMYPWWSAPRMSIALSKPLVTSLL